MNKSYKTPRLESQSKEAVEGKAELLKYGLIGLKNSFQGAKKRIECQAIAKMIKRVGKQNIKTQRIKFMVCLYERIQRQKKQNSFNRIKIYKIYQAAKSKGMKNINLIMKRISKNFLIFALDKLKGKGLINSQTQIKKPLRSSSRSVRQSSESNIFSVSEDSLQGSRSIIFEDSQPLTQEQILNLRKENQQLKRMVLSEEVKESLLKMQRFDRYIYNIESQKVLKQPVTKELRRLQKMKNQIKGMRAKFYDNELTVTCLFNHVKLVSEMNRQLQDTNSLKLKISEMENKIAELNTQHRKQIAQFKRKLLFFDVSSSRDKSTNKELPVTQSKALGQTDIKNLEFTNQELTTFNIIIAALKNKKYKDVRRQIDHFGKKSKKQNFLAILKEVLVLIDDNDSSISQSKENERLKTQIIGYLTQFDKFLRIEKIDQLQKLKNKCKTQAPSVELFQLFESVINLYSEIKRLRKKQSQSVDKQFKSAEKEKMKKSIESQNEQLKKQVKNLQIRLENLEGEKQKLQQAIKKNQRAKPTLPPRRPISTEKQTTQTQNQAQIHKKYQQNELKLKKQIEQLSKQIAQINEKSQQSQEKYQARLSKLQEENNVFKNSQKELKTKLKEFQTGIKVYSTIKQKKAEQQNYLRDINEFKRFFPESIFCDIFISGYNEQQSSQAVLNHLKNIFSLFNQNAWKRKTTFTIKQQTQISTLLNSIVQILFNVHLQREDYVKVIEQMKKKEASLNNENAKALNEKSRISEEIVRLKQENFKNIETISKLKEQTSSSQIVQKVRTKSPQKITRQNSTVSNLKNENEQLRSQLEVTKQKLTDSNKIIQKLKASRQEVLQSTTAYQKQTTKEVQDFMKAYDIITNKKGKRLSYQRELTQLKQKYPSSAIVDLLQTQLTQQVTINTLITNMKQISSWFNQKGTKRRSNLLLKEQNEVYICFNQFTQLLTSALKEKDELMQSVNDLQHIKQGYNQLSQQLFAVKTEKQQLLQQNKKRIFEVDSLKTKLISQQNIVKDTQKIANTVKQTTQRQIIQMKSQITQLLEEKQQAIVTIENLKQQLQKNKMQLTQIKNVEMITNKKQSNDQTLTNRLYQIQHIHLQGTHEIVHELKLDQYEERLINTEEKLANYKLLFEKTKKQRDNLKLLIEEKNQEYELCKENEEKYEEIKRISQEKIIELKYSYESNQLQIRKIENQIERLLLERSDMQTEKHRLETHMNELIDLKNREIQQIKRLLQDQTNTSRLLQHEISHLQKKSELEILNIQQEKNYLSKCLQIAEEESNRNKTKYEAELQDYKIKCERYTAQLHQYKEDFSLEREILRRKMTEITQISEMTPINKSIEDHQKLELRRQLDLINEQLAKTLRNSQNQKREARKYIEQIINEAQMQSTLYNQEKRILRQEIERARSQEYAINQEKIRKLREDIQALRSQNQRLTSIIDQNQTSFNQLVSEHKDMHQGIIQLQEHNSQLQNAILLSQQQKQQLQSRLQELQAKLSDFQNKIVFAMNEGQIKQEEQLKKSQNIVMQLQATINNLSQQNNYLSSKNSQQARQLIEMQREIIKIQAQYNNLKSIGKAIDSANTAKSSDYSKYLQEKIETYESQIKRYTNKQTQMLSKMENLIKTVNQLQNQRQKHAIMKNDQDLKSTLNKAQLERQLIRIRQKVIQFELEIKSKDEQIIHLKRQHQNHRPENPELQAKITQLEQKHHRIALENYRLKSIAEQYNRLKINVQQRVEQNQRLILENKRLSHKIIMIEQSVKSVQEKYLKSQTQIHNLQVKLQENLFQRAISTHQSLSISNINKSSNIKQDLNWHKEQLQQKITEINQLRIKQIHLQASLKRSEETIAQLMIKQQRYYRQSYQHQDTKQRLRSVEIQLASQRSMKKVIQEDHQSLINQKNQEIFIIREENQLLKEANKKLAQKLASDNKYEQEFLFEIVKQLDENYVIQGQQQEIQIRVLQKISTQISEIIEMNALFKQKCQAYQRNHYQHLGQTEVSTLASIKFMIYDLIEYLSSNQIINPQQIPQLPQQASPQKLIYELGPLLKELFSNSIRNNQQEIVKYNNVIRQIKSSIEEFYQNNSLQSLNKLRILLS